MILYLFLLQKPVKDIQFPKHSSSYEEISSYLELNVDYLPSMDIFDEAWEKYLENNHDL